MEELRIADPCGRASVDEERAFAPAARPSTLQGIRLATLDNGKPNAGHALSRLAALLAARGGVVEGPARGKARASQPCPDDLLGELEETDAALVGVGD